VTRSGPIRRWIIDGDNLRHAWPTHAGAALGRVALCEALRHWVRRAGVRVTVVFDGPAPRRELERQIRHGEAEVIFSGPRSADEVIEDLIEQAPSAANLVVVSSDHAVRAAARRRRAQAIKSHDFVINGMAPSGAPRRRPAAEPVEPDSAGHNGEGDAAHWLREFGLDAEGPEDVTDMMG